MSPIPPVDRSVLVSWDPETAFRRFALDFGTWWPSHSHSIGGSRVKRVVLEARADGLIFEEHVDGRRFQWGQIQEWDPPRGLRFTWHPTFDAEKAQDVSVTFSVEPTGTRVRLVSTGWEKHGEKAVGMRRGYDMGWGHILQLWAGQWSVSRVLLESVMAVLGFFSRLRGLDRQIAKARGEIPAG
jgi:uncharacterized protein YndB with AHSA1/START domain